MKLPSKSSPKSVFLLLSFYSSIIRVYRIMLLSMVSHILDLYKFSWFSLADQEFSSISDVRRQALKKPQLLII